MKDKADEPMLILFIYLYGRYQNLTPHLYGNPPSPSSIRLCQTQATMTPNFFGGFCQNQVKLKRRFTIWSLQLYKSVAL